MDKDVPVRLRDGVTIYVDLFRPAGTEKVWVTSYLAVRWHLHFTRLPVRFTGSGGNRLTAFVTNTTRGQLADLEPRHRIHSR